MHENSLQTQVFGWHNESRGHLGAAEAVDQRFLNIPLRMLLNKIADSKKTVVRFEGRQYFDNVTISATDKQAIRDMFVAEEALKKQASVTTEKP